MGMDTGRLTDPGMPVTCGREGSRGLPYIFRGQQLHVSMGLGIDVLRESLFSTAPTSPDGPGGRS